MKKSTNLNAETAECALYEVEEKYGGRVEAALEPIDRQDVMARTTRGILAVVAEAERLNAVARMERGKRRRAERGYLMGAPNPLYGYRWLDDEPGKRTAYIEDTEAAPVVRRIFSLAKAGMSLRAIARLLNAEKVPTRAAMAAYRGHNGRHHVGQVWRPEMVRRILNDRTYIGEATAYRWHRVQRGTTTLRALRPVDDILSVSLNVPPLIDEETFTVAQQTIQRQEKGRPPIDAAASWLRGHVSCGACGGRMFIKRGHDRNPNGPTKYEYECRNRRGSSVTDACCPAGNPAIRGHLLDQDAYEALQELLQHRYDLEQLMVQRLGIDKILTLGEMAEGFAAQLRQKKEEVETAKRRAIQTKDDDLAQEFIAAAEAAQASIRELEKEYAEARQQLNDFNAGNAWVQSVLDRIYARPTVEDVRNLPLEERRLLLAASGMQVIVHPVGWNDGKRIDVKWDITSHSSVLRRLGAARQAHRRLRPRRRRLHP
jgi:hypothetical protein